jgi:hypothetical protein
VLKPLVAALALVAVIALPGVASGAGVLDSGRSAGVPIDGYVSGSAPVSRPPRSGR